MVITWVTSSAMLRPSTAVCGFADTALHTTEKEDELFAFWYLMLLLLLLEMGPTTQNCLGVVSSDLGLKREDVNGLIREAEPIFLCSLSRSRCLLMSKATVSFSSRWNVELILIDGFYLWFVKHWLLWGYCTALMLYR